MTDAFRDFLQRSNRVFLGAQELAAIYRGGEGLVWEPGSVAAGPINTVAPAVTGDPFVGATLTRTLGTWTGTGTISYATQWLRGGTAISGATGATYVQQAADAGQLITARVTATDDEGSRSAVSNAAATSYPQPVAAGELADVVVDQDSGDWTVAAAADFTGVGLTYALQSGPPGTSVNASTGVVTGTSANVLSAAAVVVRASTPDGKFADSGFSVTVQAVAPGDVAPTITAEFAQASYTDGDIITGSDLDVTIGDAGSPAVGVEDLTVTLLVDGLAATLPHTTAAGETVQIEVTGSHATGPISVLSDLLTVQAVVSGLQVDGLAEGVGAEIVSVSDTEIVFRGMVSVDASGGTGPRRPSMRITNAEGLTPTFKWLGRGAVLASNPMAGHHPHQLFYATDPAENTGLTLASASSTVGDDLLVTFPGPLPAGPIWVHSRTPSLFQWWQARIDEWVADPLTAETESAVAFGGDPYVVGVAPGGRDHLDVRDLPPYAARAFRIGTGPLKVLAEGGIHISETMGGSYVFAGMVDWLLSSDPDAVAARSACTFYIYPCFNFHASYSGGDRSCEDQLIDANRSWDNTPPSPTPQMRTLWQAAIEIDKGAVGFTASFDFHDYGTSTTRTAYIDLFDLGAGNSATVKAAIVALSPKIRDNGTRPTSNTDRFMAWCGRNAMAATYACIQIEGDIREGPTQWLEIGQWLVKGLMVRVDAGDFDGNIPVVEWDIAGGVQQLTINSGPTPAAPGVPVVSGGATQLTITG